MAVDSFINWFDFIEKISVSKCVISMKLNSSPFREESSAVDIPVGINVLVT